MVEGLVLSIDGMGGDAAPDVVVEGVDICARRMPGAHYLIHGDAARIEALLERFPAARAASKVVPAEKAIGMEVKPSASRREGHGRTAVNSDVVIDFSAARECGVYCPG